MRVGLARLALRRTLSPAAGLVLALTLALALVAPGSSAPLLPGADVEALLRNSRRLDVWSAFLALVAPVLLFGAARLSPTNLRWLRTSPEPRGRAAAALLVGTLAAAALATLVAAVAAEVAAGEGPPSWRVVASCPAPGTLLSEAAPQVEWQVPELAHAPRPCTLRLAVTIAPGSGPATTACWSAQEGASTVVDEARVGGRTWLHVTLPAAADRDASGPRFVLRRTHAEGALLALMPGGLERLEPVASERLGSVAIALRAFLLAAAALALALGLATRLRPSLAAGVPLAAALAVVALGIAPGVLPGGDLGAAWSRLATGLVPTWPSATVVGTTLVLVGAGLGLASTRAEAPR